MSTRNLRIVPPPAEPQSTYIEVSQPTRAAFAELDAKVSRVRTFLSGSFSGAAKLPQVQRDLAEIEALARSIRRGF